MEPRRSSLNLAAGCLVLLLGCWGPQEVAAAVSAGRPPCSPRVPRSLPGAAAVWNLAGELWSPLGLGWLKVESPDRSPAAPGVGGEAGPREGLYRWCWGSRAAVVGRAPPCCPAGPDRSPREPRARTAPGREGAQAGNPG